MGFRFRRTLQIVPGLRLNLSRSTISLEYNLQDDQTRAYQEFSNAFRELVKSRRVWRIPAKIGQSDWKRHAGASTTIERNPISLSVSTPNLINSNLEFMCVPLGTKNLYFTPDAILLVAGNSVAALRYDDLEIGCEPTRFIENEQLPGDAEVVGESWIYVNKDGTADRRFGNNKKLPIYLYGEIYLKSDGGLNERIHCSRLNAAKEFVACAVAMRHTNSALVKVGGASAHSFPTEDLARREELDPTLAFAKESEKARTLTLEHGEFWGYLLTEELLKSKLRVLKTECDEFEKTLLLIPKKRFGSPDFISWLNGKMQELASAVEKMAKNVNEDLPASLGKTEVSGDAIQILRAVNSLFGGFQTFLAFELDVCAAEPPLKLKVFETTFRGITLSLIGSVERFTDEWGRALEGLRAGSHEFQATFKLPSLPQLQRATEEMKKIGEHPALYT